MTPDAYRKLVKYMEERGVHMNMTKSHDTKEHGDDEAMIDDFERYRGKRLRALSLASWRKHHEK